MTCSRGSVTKIRKGVEVTKRIILPLLNKSNFVFTFYIFSCQHPCDWLALTNSICFFFHCLESKSNLTFQNWISNETHWLWIAAVSRMCTICALISFSSISFPFHPFNWQLPFKIDPRLNHIDWMESNTSSPLPSTGIQLSETKMRQICMSSIRESGKLFGTPFKMKWIYK